MLFESARGMYEEDIINEYYHDLDTYELYEIILDYDWKLFISQWVEVELPDIKEYQPEYYDELIEDYRNMFNLPDNFSINDLYESICAYIESKNIKNLHSHLDSILDKELWINFDDPHNTYREIIDEYIDNGTVAEYISDNYDIDIIDEYDYEMDIDE